MALLDAAAGALDLGGEEAGPVEVEEGAEVVAEEAVDGGGALGGDVGASEPPSDAGAVPGLDEGVVVGAPWPGLGELGDVELLEHPGDAVVDVLGAVVGVEALDAEGEGRREVFEDGREEVLGDADDGADVLELGDPVDDVERVQALLAVEVAPVDGVDADEAGAALGVGPAADADGDPDGAGLVRGEGSQAVVTPRAEVVDVAVGGAREALEALVAADFVLAAEDLLGGGSREPAVDVVDLGQKGDITRGVAMASAS
ncbi:hypothetical protein [Candidatus Palauibacter sp.]|uniref:hypothetical protein n=1 Tax=Candidatus Palauibacter sp. TaxID=3101350 RepID=UPI003B5B9B08